MLIGITIDKFKGINPSVLIKLTRKIGLNFIEITKSVFNDLPNVLNELGNIKTGFHLPNFHDNGYDFSSEKHSAEIDQLVDLLNENHEALRIQYCLSHPPEIFPNAHTDEKTTSRLFKNLQRLKPPIIIENIASLSQAQFEQFYEKAEKNLGDKLVGQCYDGPHYYVSGEDPVAVLNNIDGVIKTVHLSDCKREKDTHLPFGLGGELPIDEILATLKNLNYQGIINLELLPRSLDDLEKVVHSYLKVLRVFNRSKYYHTRARLMFYLPILKRIISN